jgi:hypothetical protein
MTFQPVHPLLQREIQRIRDGVLLASVARLQPFVIDKPLQPTHSHLPGHGFREHVLVNL